MKPRRKNPSNPVFLEGLLHPWKFNMGTRKLPALEKEKHLPNLQFFGFHVGFWECKLNPCRVFFRRFAFGISLISHKHNNKHGTDLSPVEIGPRIHEKTTLRFHPDGWKKSGVHQLIWYRYPHNLNGFYTSQVVVWDFWTITSLTSDFFSVFVHLSFEIDTTSKVWWRLHSDEFLEPWADDASIDLLLNM